MSDKEKVKDLCEKWWVATKQNEGMVIEQWLEQNPVDPVVVGLSDKQVEDLSNFIQRYQHRNGTVTSIENWLKTQTFTQQYKTDGFAEMQLEECGIEYRALKKEFEQLKSQQFTQNSERALIDIKHMIRSSMIQSRFGIFDKILDVIESVIKPTPQVTVGDIWMHKKTGNKYYIDGFCKTKICDDWCKSVMYHVGDARYTRTLSDFVDKFEQVQP
jgi:hypothetical protein